MKSKFNYAIECCSHTYITLYRDGKFVHCYDNGTSPQNCMDLIIKNIEKVTKMEINDIPIIGSIDDFDGLYFLSGDKKGEEWLNNNPISTIKKGELQE